MQVIKGHKKKKKLANIYLENLHLTFLTISKPP